MSEANELSAIEPFLGELLQSLQPRERKKLMDKLLRFARRANADRIAKNVQPDGSAMTPRKKRPPGQRPKRGKMFRRIGKQSSLRIRANPDAGELVFVNRLVEQTAAEHQYGLTGFVGKTKAGKVIRTKYPARLLLGFGEEQKEFADEVLKHLSAEG